MRIMAADLSDVTVYRAEAKPSEYIGTKTEYVENGTIRAQIQPVTDKIAVSLYGNRVEQMKNLICEYGSDIEKGDKAEVRGEMYKIVNVLKYSTHTTAIAEREGLNENRSKGA